MRRILVITLLLVSSLFTNLVALDVVCYESSLDDYSSIGGLQTDYTLAINFDPKLCSHYVYSKSTLDVNESTNSINEPDLSVINDLAVVKGLKNRNPELKTMIYFRNFLSVSNRSAIPVLVQTTVAFLKNNSLDGVDISLPDRLETWANESRITFQMTIEALRAAFDSNKLTLSATAYQGRDYDVSLLDKNLNFINLYTINFNLPSYPETELRAMHPHPLQSDNSSELTADSLIKYWINRGFPANKINLGMSTLAYSWLLTSNITTPPAPANGPGITGESFANGNYPGVLAYGDVCKTITNGYQVFRDSKNYTGPYAVSPATSGQQSWIGYDDPAMAIVKSKYVIDNGLRGINLDELSLDDFNNTCGTGFHPITAAISKTLMSSSQPTVAPLTTQKPSKTTTTTKKTTTKTTTRKKTTTKKTTIKKTTIKKTTTKPKTTKKTTI